MPYLSILTIYCEGREQLPTSWIFMNIIHWGLYNLDITIGRNVNLGQEPCQ